MSKYSSAPWSARFATLGDEAEGVYLAVRPLGPTTKWGFRRPEGVAVSKFPSVAAHTPDMVTYTHAVEVMGMGRDGILKSVKVEKWDALKIWQKITKLMGYTGGLMFFVWNTAAKEFVVLDYKAVAKLVKRSVAEHGIQQFENDKNEYYPIDWAWLKEAAIWSDTYEPKT